MEAQSLHDMNEVSRVLVRTPGNPGDLTSVLQHIAQTAQNSFATDACVILAFNPITGRFIGSQTVVENSRGENETLHEEPGLDGVTQEVLRDNVVLVKDLEAKPQYHNRFTRKEGIRAFAGLALRTRHRKRPLGVIYLDFRQPKEFSSIECESFLIFAVEAGLLLQETWLAHNYEEVARIGQEVNQNLAEVGDLFQRLQTYVDTILDDSHALLLGIYQPQKDALDLHVKEHGHTFLVNTPLQGAYRFVIKAQQSWFIEQLSKEVEQLPFQMTHITGTEQKESLIFVPLILRGVSLGVLSIQHPLPNAYGQEDLFILQLLAIHISLALHNMRLYGNLTRLNETGQLLTQQLDSEQVLQTTVDKIRDATEADIVVLYPYESAFQRFVLPPRIAGTLLDATFPQPSFSRPDDIAVLTLRHGESIFAEESTTIYTKLRGDVHLRQESFSQREKIRSMVAIPLRVGDKSLGVLFVNFRQPHRFDSPQKRLIEGLAHYAAIAIKNAQAYGTLIQRRIRELEILQNIDRELSRTLDLESVLNTLLRLALEHVPAEEASILLHDPAAQILKTSAAIGRHAEVSRTQVIPLYKAKGITHWVVENKKPARVDNIRRDLPWRDLYLPVASDIISELDVPLLDSEEVVGVINFESTRESAFRQEDQDFLVTLAGQAVLAIKKAQAYEREKRLVEEGQVLNEISKEITSQLDLAHVFDLILEKALKLTNSATGELMFYDPDQQDLWMASERGVIKEKKGQRLSLDQGVVGYVARTKQWLFVDPSQSPWNEIFLDYIPGTRSELAVPMLAGGDLRGVLNVESPTPNNFNERDLRLLIGLSDLAVIALQNAQAYEREKRLVTEGQVLNEISKKITSQLDLAHVFDLILEKALELTNSTLGSLHLYDLDLKDLWMTSERGVAEDKKALRQKIGQGIVGYVAKNKRLLNVKDVFQTPWNEIYLEFFPGARSELAVPMLEGNDLRGVLNVESPSPSHFSERDESLLQGLSDLAVVALQNAERYEKAEREAQRFGLLYKAGQELGKITEWTQLEQAYDLTLQIAEEYSQCQVVIRRYEVDTLELVLIRASQQQDFPPIRRMKLDESLNEQIVQERRTIVIYDTANPHSLMLSVELLDPAIHSLAITPITFEDRYYGNLIFSHRDVGYFRVTDVSFFDGLAQQLAITIYRLETVQARHEAEEMSWIGEIAFSLTHRLDNALGLVGSYVGDIRKHLEKQGVVDIVISTKLENIKRATRTVLDMSRTLKDTLTKSGEAMAGEPIGMLPKLLLEEAYAQTAPSLSSDTQIYLEIDDDVATIRAIPNLVADILQNLIANAIQAMPEGGTITLKARNAGRLVVLEVADTGPGIPLQNQVKIFGLFYSTKRSSGFGLWSARRYARKCGGDLKVESRPGQGAIFKLFLPSINEGAVGEL